MLAAGLLPLAGGGLIVGFGRFRPWLEALAVALAEADDAAARWVAENGGLRLELVGQEIAVGRWSNASTFIGYLDHRYAPYVLAAMDVLVVPSILEEAFGMVAAEGAASGALPLVARHSGLAEVSDALLDKCRPIAGTPSDCIGAIEEYRDAGCTHVMLELWGENRHDQIRLFGEQVLPHFRS